MNDRMAMTVFQDVAERGDARVFPMSLAQERLWLLDQLEPHKAAYIMPLAIRLRGWLDVEALERSLNTIVQRHEVLRATFRMMEGQPAQVIASTVTVPLSRVDLQDFPEEEREVKAWQLAAEEARRPFDLIQGPLLRLTLLRLGAEGQMLLLNIHRIVCDRCSIGVFLRELATLYEAFATGHSSPLPELPMQYADFAVWQRETLQGELFAEHLAYWKQHLVGSPAGLDLPTDRPYLAAPTLRGSTSGLRLAKGLTEALKELSRQEGVTLEMVLVAAFQTLLHRYTGQEDLVIGTVMAGCRQAETEGLIGCFANTVVLRTDLSGGPSFLEVLGRVRQVLLEAQAHQDLPFEYLIKELQPERKLSQNPLFQVSLVLEPSRPALPSGWTLAQMAVETGTSKLDLTLALEDRPEGLLGCIEYRTDLFDQASIARMAGHWQTLLEGIVADPTRAVAALPLLRERERHQLLVEWNATQLVYPKEKCVHQLFEEQVERSPEAVAVVFEGKQLTYRELNRRANQLAHYLQHLGVGPEVLVGLCVERSLDMVVGLLGILKAGGAYVPLDPGFPSERIAFMLEDAQAPVLVTQQYLTTPFPKEGTKVVCLDTDRVVLAQQNEANVLPSATSANLAYVIYTSGSTGHPKGVQIIHRAVANFLLSMRELPGLREEDTLLAVTTLSFDIAALELFLPLVVGARVIVVGRDVAINGAVLMETLARTRTTLMQATPVTWRILLAAGWQGNPRLKVLCGGEALPLELAQQLLPKAASLWNLYGPTETTIWSSVCQIKPSEEAISIGRPIANTQIYLLDAHLQPVPIGVPGELYIGGDGLARGYLKRPELTAERFIPHPFSDEPGACLYKTGDLARYCSDGTIEHLGRLDFQVKLRGFRIELGEIEAVLSQHPAVHQAVVMAREDTSGEKQLVAYVVFREGQSTMVSDLQDHVRKHLPIYMVPSVYMQLELFPLTPNGKVDRRALPKPEMVRTEVEGSCVAPTTLVQHQLVEIWEELLNVRPLGMRDNFFDVGGHSLLAARLVSRIEQVCGKKVSLATFFEGATIEHLAHALQMQEGTESRSPVVAVQAGGSKRPFFFLHGDWTGGAFYCLKLAHYLGLDQPFYVLEPFKFDGLQVPPTFEAIAAAHLESLRAVQPEGPYLLGGYCNGGLVAYEVARQLRAEGQTVDLLVLMDPDAPARHRWVRSVIRSFCSLIRLGQDKQFDWFLCVQHIYRYLGFSHYRRLKNSELLGNVAQGELGCRHSKVGFTPLSLRLKALLPKVETLRRDYPKIYDWVISDYMPGLCPGKITFFWTSEESWRSVGWQKVVEAKEGEVEIHSIPGNHITGRTEYLHLLAEHLRTCLSKAQSASLG